MEILETQHGNQLKRHTLKNQQSQWQHVKHWYPDNNSKLHLYDLQMYQSNRQFLHFWAWDWNLNGAEKHTSKATQDNKVWNMLWANNQYTRVSTNQQQRLK